jgi:Protein of unknown function (DUF3987)
MLDLNRPPGAAASGNDPAPTLRANRAVAREAEVAHALDTFCDTPRWVAWRNERRGDKLLTKIPYTSDGRHAKADDSATWGIRADVEVKARSLVNGLGGGVGIQLGDLGGDLFLAGLDLDSCIGEDGTLASWAQTILDGLPTYAEISPSGRGLKMYFYIIVEDVRPFLDFIGAGSEQWGTRRGVPGFDGGDHGPAVEVYFSHRFFAVTENRWLTSPDALATLDHDALEHLARHIPPPRSQINGKSGSGDNSRSARALAKAIPLRRVGKSFEEMVDALQTDPETSSWVRDKGLASNMRELRRTWEKAGQIISSSDTEESIRTAISAPPWPKPLSDAAYHGIAGEFVRTILPHTEADPAALLFQLLTFAGNVFGDTAWLTVERTKHYANLFIVVVGATAKSRKGTAEGWVRDLLRIAAPTWDRNCIASGLSTGEGLIARVRDPEYGKDKKGRDELIHPGVADKRLLIVESEFSRPLHVMERGGNSTLSAVLRDASDHKPLSILTRNDPVKAHGASISIVAHITCEELRRDLTDVSTANGFANRFLWAVAQRSKALPFGGNVSDGALEELAHKLRASLEQPSVGPIRFDEIARHKWHNVYPDLTEDHPGLLGALTARTEAQVVRVAIIYALLDHQHLIGKAHLDAALEVVRYSNDSVRHIFGDTTGNTIADTILKALRGNSEGLSRWDISNLFSGNTKSAVIIDALSQLLAVGKIRSQRVSTGGRPAEVWFAA